MAYHEPSNGNSYGRNDDGSNGSMINSSKNSDDSRKIFVGGISWESTADDVRGYFERYGKVADVIMKVNPTTGRPRGFGFVLFAEQSSVDKVVREKNHVLNGKQIDPKRAVAGGNTGDLVKKIFVGGLDPSLTEQDVMRHFSQYGKVEHVELPFDKVKNQRRAFGFITFESEDAVNEICANSKIPYGDKMVDVKKAVNKHELNGTRAERGGRGGYSGRGRGGPPAPPGGGYGPPGYDYGSAYPGYPPSGSGYPPSGAGYPPSGSGYPGYDYYGHPASGYGPPSSSGYPGSGYASGYGGSYGGWGSGYDQSGGYGPPPSSSYPGYDYSGGWQGGDASAYGKVKRGGSGDPSSSSSAAPAQSSSYGYHPYSR